MQVNINNNQYQNKLHGYHFSYFFTIFELSGKKKTIFIFH